MSAVTAQDFGLSPTISANVSSVSSGTLSGPQAMPAAWFANVERRIRDSMLPTDRVNENDGRWLEQNVALAAIRFFREASEMLSVEPFIYRSNAGDLVAEFQTKGVLLTGIVTPQQFLAVSTINGAPQQLMIDLTINMDGEVRRQLRKLTESLNK